MLCVVQRDLIVSGTIFCSASSIVENVKKVNENFFLKINCQLINKMNQSINPSN